MKLLFLLMIVVGCSEHKPSTPKVVDDRYCIDRCVESKMMLLHGGKFLGGASSLNGFTQAQTFDRFLSYCQDFSKGNPCCTTQFGTKLYCSDF